MASWGLLAASAAPLAGCAVSSRGAAPSLAGTRWEVTGLHGVEPATGGVLPGARPTLVFDDAGRVGGSSGCNRFSAAVVALDGGLRISAPATTRMACAEAGVMDQELAFLRALEAVRTARIEGDRLELRGADGALQISARALQARP